MNRGYKKVTRTRHLIRDGPSSKMGKRYKAEERILCKPLLQNNYVIFLVGFFLFVCFNYQ